MADNRGGLPARDRLATELGQRFGGIVATDVRLSGISQWKVGGCADVLYRPGDTERLAEAMAWLHDQNIPTTVIGLTTNLLFSDAGVRGVVIQLADGFGGIAKEGRDLVVGAGVWVPYVALYAMHNGLGGLEHICGIPGALGGLISMNGGSLRKSISENLITVDVLSRRGEHKRIAARACSFGYRASRFQSSDEVILSCRLRLTDEADPGTVRRRMIDILRARKRFPRKQPNCGSVFVSDPELYENFGAPGKVIEDLGFKGFEIGGARVSPAHANFIINTGHASALDVLTLIHTIRERVYEVTNHRMRVEAKYVREDGRFVPADGLEVLGGAG